MVSLANFWHVYHHVTGILGCLSSRNYFFSQDGTIIWIGIIERKYIVEYAGTKIGFKMSIGIK